MSAWFDSWDSLVRILISGVTGYFMLILHVRVVGKRATSKMNNFDWIVTVAIGSVLASMVVLKDVTVADGALAMALLLGLQYLLTTATSRFAWARKLFLSDPSLLYLRGEFHDEEMRKQRISREEMESRIRECGVASWGEVEAITFEPNAEIAVVRSDGSESLETVRSVRGFSASQEDGSG